MKVTITNWNGLENVSPSFIKLAILELSKLGWDYDAALGTISHESNFLSKSVNSANHAGLIQFSPETIAKYVYGDKRPYSEMNLSESERVKLASDFSKLSPENQLKYILKYWSWPKVPLKGPDFLYLGMGFDPRDPFNKIYGYKKGEKGYDQNAHLDHNKNGRIDAEDIRIEFYNYQRAQKGKLEIDLDQAFINSISFENARYYWTVVETASYADEKIFEAAKKGEIQVLDRVLFDRNAQTWIKVLSNGDIPSDLRFITPWHESDSYITVIQAIPEKLTQAEKNKFFEDLEETIEEIKKDFAIPALEIGKYVLGGIAVVGVGIILYKIFK